MHVNARPTGRYRAGISRAALLNLLATAAGTVLLGWPMVLGARQSGPTQAASWKQSNVKPASSAVTAVPPPGYTIAPGDLLDVYVVAVPELSRSYRVDPSGRITLPMLNQPVAAQGLTPDELAEAIGRALSRQGLISHPDVLVSVESSPSNTVAVTGSVAKPGVYAVFGPTTIVEMISQAGGLSPDAGSTAIVMRGPTSLRWLQASGASDPQNRPPQPAPIIKVPIRRLLDTGDAPHDLLLYPGDEIDVTRAGIVYVVGAVNRAGGFALTGEQNEITVLQAIALAGNVTRTAMLKNAFIIRQDPATAGEREQIQVDLKKVLAGKSPDRALSTGDILFVPDSTGKQVLARALAAATSVAIYRAPL